MVEKVDLSLETNYYSFSRPHVRTNQRTVWKLSGQTWAYDLMLNQPQARIRICDLQQSNKHLLLCLKLSEK